MTSICDQSLALVSASFTVPSSAVAGPTVDSVAAKAPAAQQAAYLASVKQKAAASCEKQLKVQQAVWGYLPARAVEIAIDATITVLTATAVCYFAPTACTWGVRVGAFVGGFMGSFAFQYLTDGTVDWKTAGYALLDAAVSMFTFAGLDSLAEKYVEQGVTSALGEAGSAVTSVANRVGGLGSGFVTYVQNAADWINTNVLQAAGWAGPLPVAYHGGATFESASTATKSATPIRIRAVEDSYESVSGGESGEDLHSGSGTSEYFDWTITKVGYTNSDGAIGYAISQGNQCLNAAGSYAKVVLATCDYATNSQQVFFMDGDELMAYNGECVAEGQDGNRWLSNCDGLNYVTDANGGANDDQWAITGNGKGTAYPDTIANWQNDLSLYETG